MVMVMVVVCDSYGSADGSNGDYTDGNSSVGGGTTSKSGRILRVAVAVLVLRGVWLLTEILVTIWNGGK